MKIDHHAPVRARATALIDAPAERVWDILTGIERWPEWNEQVAWTRLNGSVAAGTGFRWRAGGVTIRSRLLELEPISRMGWSGRTPGIRARHHWQLKPVGSQTRVCNEESFHGLLARLLPGTLTRLLQQSLQQGRGALKREAEQCQREADHATAT